MKKQLNDLLILLCRSIANHRLYSREHPKNKEQIKQFHLALHNFFRKSAEDELFVGVVDGNIVYKGSNLVGPSIMGKQFIDFTEKLQCGGISFSNETTSSEIANLFNCASGLTSPVSSLEEARELLLTLDVVNIKLASHYTNSSMLNPQEQEVWQGKESNQVLATPSLIYQALFDMVATNHSHAAEGKELDIKATKGFSEYLLQYTQANFSDMMQQIQYPDFDTYTVGHSVRVATLAVFVGSQMDLSEKKLLELGTAGLLHDVGKSKIPESILFKTGKLTEEEFDVIRTHSQIGAEILLEQDNTTELDIAAAWGHHIRHDGKGYPPPPSWGVKTPFVSLIQICDVFEALTAIRPYKAPMTPHVAFITMLNDKGAFDPNLLAFFIKTVGLYPPGNNVELTNGSKGRVLSVGQQIDRPKLEITHDVDGSPLESEKFFVLDLERASLDDIGVKRLLLN